MVDAVGQHEENVGVQKEDAVTDHLGICGEEADGLRRKDKEGCRDDHGHGEGHADRGPGAPVRAPVSARTDVLADEGGRRHGHALHGQHDELVELVIRAPARHAGGSEHVHVGLDKDVGQGCDDGLNARRHADREDLLQDGAVSLKIPPGEAVDLPAS